MGPVETATTSFGQGMTATAMQLATAYAAIANGGTLYRPRILRRVLDGDGKVSAESAPEGHRVIDAALASTLRTMLQAVTQPGGTAEKLSLPGYRFAGKTGTAQKVDPATRRYSNEKWASSFVGFAPLDDPRIVLYVVIDEPQGGHFGSLVAGPVFEEVVGDALRWLGVQPTEAAPRTPEPAKPPSARQLAQAPRATPRSTRCQPPTTQKIGSPSCVGWGSPRSSRAPPSWARGSRWSAPASRSSRVPRRAPRSPTAC